ncbi:glutaredoxin family protein [Parafrankia sp. BMG5.11]|uniref:glutaredoxin family protein n=2 Tax=unclassified Parafrankia TaxID=2994368 RepID=UPI000DA562CF|nr:glutaredoxin family protein [Parafrankia sp. BMG5.11]SQD93596.1 Glutaredoxin 2 (modular protein) [Parafrankia sp. Ea1.12]
MSPVTGDRRGGLAGAVSLLWRGTIVDEMTEVAAGTSGPNREQGPQGATSTPAHVAGDHVTADSPAGDGAAGGEVPGVRITLLTRVGCHLCDDARQVIERVSADVGAGWRELDVDADPRTADTYGDRVPVILVDGREHGYWRVEEQRLRRALAGDRWSWLTGRSGGSGRSGRSPASGTS